MSGLSQRQDNMITIWGVQRVPAWTLTSVLMIAAITIFRDVVLSNLRGSTIDSNHRLNVSLHRDRQLLSPSDFADPRSSIVKLHSMQYTKNASEQNCLDVRGQHGSWIPYEGYNYEHPMQVDVQKLKDIAQQQALNPKFQRWTQWKWQDDSPQCQLEVFTPGGFCNVMKYFDFRRVFLLGDSLTGQMANSLLSQLYMSPQILAGSKERLVHLTFDCGKHASSSSFSFEIVYIRNDHLSLNDPTNKDCHEVCNSWLEIWLGSDLPTLFIANTGLHTTKVPKQFRKDMNNFIALIETHRSMKPKDKFVFRTNVPGHRHCSEHIAPFANYLEYSHYIASLPYGLTRDQRVQSKRVESFNDYIKRHISNLSDDWMLLDVFPMAILRPDGHKLLFSLGGRLHEDCLHYEFPGPSDFYIHLLYSNLLDLTLLKK